MLDWDQSTCFKGSKEIEFGNFPFYQSFVGFLVSLDNLAGSSPHPKMVPTHSHMALSHLMMLKLVVNQRVAVSFDSLGHRIFISMLS